MTRQIMQRSLAMVDRLTAQMAAMKTMCVYRVNGFCWEQCPAREYCRPEECGLATVRDLREGAGEDDSVAMAAQEVVWRNVG